MLDSQLVRWTPELHRYNVRGLQIACIDSGDFCQNISLYCYIVYDVLRILLLFHSEVANAMLVCDDISNMHNVNDKLAFVLQKT